MDARLKLVHRARHLLMVYVTYRAAPARAYGEESKYFDLNVRPTTP